ncbi:MAG TPA: peptide deformylase [Polyangiaceae bacterium]|jgi:peptide deformylase|nr:peptide deformylase [Polyangiaceae bacterium]
MPFDLEAWLAVRNPSVPIVQAGAPVLRRRAREVPASLLGTPALAELVQLMVDTMRAAPGVGLAAPQIGVPLRIFVAEDSDERMAHVPEATRTLRGRRALPLVVLVNPEVTLVPGDDMTFYEGCLSVRGYGALVRRANTVVAQGVDERGAPVTARLAGWPARIMQHEMDHLNGTLYIDRMIGRSFASDTELGRLSAVGVDDVLREIGENSAEE